MLAPLTIRGANTAWYDAHGLHAALRTFLARFVLKIGKELVFEVPNGLLMRGTTKYRYFVIFGGEIVKIPNVKRRNLPFFGEIFVENTVVLAVTVLKTGRKQQETKHTNLNFLKLFSDWKNIKFQEN